jgi:hypothetical protein
VTTAIGYNKYEVKFVLTEKPGPRGPAIYRLEGKFLPEKLRLLLVPKEAARPCRLLILNEKGKPARVILLEITKPTHTEELKAAWLSTPRPID